MAMYVQYNGNAISSFEVIMIVGCARIILVFSFISTEVRGSENGVTETVFRKIFAPDSDVPVQYKSLEGNKLNPKEIYLEVNCIL